MLKQIMPISRSEKNIDRFNLFLFIIASIFIVIIFLTPIEALAQENPQLGHGALDLWNTDAIAKAPTWVQYWLFAMLSSFALGLLFVWRRVEARWIVGGIVASMMASRLVVPALGLVQYAGLTSLLHLIFWTPGLFLLLKNRPFMKERSLYGLWTGLILAVIIFSFIFDIRDAAIYLDYILGINLL